MGAEVIWGKQQTRLMKQKITLKDKKDLENEQVENVITQVVLMKINKKLSLYSLFLKTIKRKSRVSFVQLKPISNIFLCGFSLFSCPQHSLKVLLLLNPMCLLKYVLNCKLNFSFFIF
jgi:CRISPR/Cas system CMR subunit Cmr6 (Cas7 group RAMP superfamily)